MLNVLQCSGMVPRSTDVLPKCQQFPCRETLIGSLILPIALVMGPHNNEGNLNKNEQIQIYGDHNLYNWG